MLRPETTQIIKDALDAERKHLSERPLLTIGQQNALRGMIKHFPGTVGAANAQQRLDIHTAIKPIHALIDKIEALIAPTAVKPTQKVGRKPNQRGTLRDEVRKAIIDNGALATGELRQLLAKKGIEHNPSYLSTLLNTSPMFDKGGDDKWRLAIENKSEEAA